MEAVNKSNTNDYAIARDLNYLVIRLIMNVYLADKAGVNGLDLKELNWAYIILVDELQRLYDKNPKLAAIEPEPIWKHLDVLAYSTPQVIKHVSDSNDHGGAHYARVEKLCILANAGTPHFTKKQKELINEVSQIADKNDFMIEDAFERNHAEIEKDRQTPVHTLDAQSTQENGGQIAKLSLAQKSLKLNFNGVTHTLKHFDSTKRFNYKLVKFLLDRPDEWVSQNDLAHFRMRSKVKDWPKLMGFTGELKDIFIDVDTKEQKIMLNPQKSLTPDEAEILKRFVNTLQ
jgi:hypothetical protein